MRRHLAKIAAIGLILAAASAGTAFGLSGGDPTLPSLPPQVVGPDPAATHLVTPDGRQAIAEQSTLSDGDTSFVDSVNGQVVHAFKENPACVGKSPGTASFNALPGGGFSLQGSVAHGATGLTVTLQDGSVVNVPLIGVGQVEYPFFDTTVASPPVSFQTLGVTPPPPCQGG